MCALETTNHGEAFACVLTQNQCAVGFENTVRIFRVNGQIRKVEWPPYHPIALVPLVPCRPAIIGDEKGAISRFDKSVNAFRVGRRDSDRDPAVWVFWERFRVFRSDRRPCGARVTGSKHATT